MSTWSSPPSSARRACAAPGPPSRRARPSPSPTRKRSSSPAAGHGARRAKPRPLLPVDSEHSAIFQIIGDRGVGEVERVVLTASGGPFRGKSHRQLQDVTVEQALQHPTWKMGPKITVDSATLMNKALEVIEARWLFDLPPEQIEVVIHPESVVHSFVEFVDGSVLAQLSPPDMRLPIQYALTYPDRLPGPAKRLDWSGLQAADFEQPDRETFPALDLGFEVARRGGTAGRCSTPPTRRPSPASSPAPCRSSTSPRVPRGGRGPSVQCRADPRRALRRRPVGPPGG